MTPARLLAACLTVLCLSCASAAEKITSQVEGLPFEAVEGSQVSFSVTHVVSAELATVTLHVEMKNRPNTVLAAEVREVSGEGKTEFAFPVPAREAENEVNFAIWYGEDWRQALVPIIHTEFVSIITAQQAAAAEAERERAAEWVAKMRQVLPAEGAVAILVDDLPGLDRELATRVAVDLRARNVPLVELAAEDVCNAGILSPEHFRALVLTSSAAYPAEGGRVLERFLAEGGDLIALGAPAFTHAVSRVEGRWMDEAQLRRLLAEQKPRTLLFDFETGSAEDWGTTQGGAAQVELDFAAAGPEGMGNALHCVVPNFMSWDTLIAPTVEAPFAPDSTLTCLWAKGGPSTQSLALEWVEEDGSRWIATIPLTEQWQHYAVPVGQFRYWRDNPSTGRGGSGDHFRPENAVRLTIGLSMTHTPMAAGRHEFWVDQIGTAPSPLGSAAGIGELTLAPIEMVTPTYKFHSVTSAVSLKVTDKQNLLAPAELSVPPGLMSVHPRPQATGFDKDRKWRWIPLLEAYDDSGEVCGTAACMVLNRTGRFAHSATVTFALPEGAYDDTVVDLVGQAVVRLCDGRFLQEGGAQFYAYFPGESVTLGARAAGIGTAGLEGCSAGFFVTSEIGTEFEQTVPLTDGVATCTWSPGQFAKSDYDVICTLLDADGRPLDVLKHPLVVWNPPDEPNFMQVRDGNFWLNGRRWTAHGINYMPSSEIGIEDGEYFEFWLDKQPYDPLVTERDLRRIAAAGMNMVSIFCYYRSLESRNLLDILERCRRHGLMVNLSLRPGTPLDFRWEEMQALIEAYRLAQNDTVFAYDLAWEPAFWGYGSRKRWDAEWERWIVERYGAIEAAEEDWGVLVPRAEGKVTGPSDEQVSTEGPHRGMVCAYRRFLDDLLAKAHATANGLVKSIDPNHLTSFRMTVAGDPTLSPTQIAYDFRGLARSVDIMQPEGYGRIGDWERVRPGMFTVDYARCMAPGRPVMWSEYGYSTWDTHRMAPDAGREQWAGDYYDRFLSMALQSDADGTVAWYYPGGYRVGERSDYGVFNPDGTWRPVTETIARYSAEMTAPRPTIPTDEWIVIDRDATCLGVQGVYEAVQDRYWELVEAGKRPGLRTDGFGLDSASAPALAVGNVPYRPGRNPHKYLNAEFDRVQVKNAAGQWETVLDGTTVKVKRGEPLLLRATVGNLADATWLAAEGTGQVALTCGEALRPIDEDVPHMGTAQIDDFQVLIVERAMDFTLQMCAWPDTVFGEKLHLRIEPEGG